MTVERYNAASGDAIIRDAACVLVVDDDAGQLRLLLGQRRPDQVFMPDKWVFPGGRVDAADFGANATAMLQFGSLALRHFANAAVRELKEETGFAAAPGSAVHLQPLARAITPPGNPRRFDTWFFLAKRSAFAPDQSLADGELLNLGWFTLPETRRLDLPFITRLIVDDAEARLGAPSEVPPSEVPFYFQNDQGYQRSLLDLGCAGGEP